MALNAGEAGDGAVTGGGDEPSIADIVVALRGAAATRGGHSVSPLHAAPSAGRTGSPRSTGLPSRETADRHAGLGMPASLPAAAIAEGEGEAELADLRDAEIARLITQNHRLNEQVFRLLNLIEREKARVAEERAASAAAQRMPVPLEAGDAVGREVKAALEAELRPILGALLRLVQRMAAERASQRAAIAEAEADAPSPSPVPAAPSAGATAPAPPPPVALATAPSRRRDERDRHANWIIDLIQAASDRSAEHGTAPPPGEPITGPTAARGAAERADGFIARLRRGLGRFGAGR